MKTVICFKLIHRMDVDKNCGLLYLIKLIHRIDVDEN